MDAEGWVHVATRAELASGRPARVRVGERWVALHSHEGRLFAVQDECPHRGATLSLGRVTADGFVECNEHGWEFSLGTGQGREAWEGCIDVFEVRVDDEGGVWVRGPSAIPE